MEEEDDIDAILDSVETIDNKTGMRRKDASRKNINDDISEKSKVHDLSDILDEFSDDDVDHEKPKCPKNTFSEVLATKQDCLSGTTNLTKCFEVFIGGSCSEMGLSTSVNKRACNRLRCSDCDFLVSSFDNYQWHPSTNYLFLRNNMPDYDRLHSKLMSKKGFRAYACQCKWIAVNELLPLQTQLDVKWFCGKH